jgi:DNA-binding CsgD family transcriptional regulator
MQRGEEGVDVEPVPRAGVHVVGREAELAVLRRVFEREDRWGALVVVGEAGIGKTTLWEAGLGVAQSVGFRVLSARASEPEVQLSFVALGDLLEGVDWTALKGVPAPQVRALEVAFVRADPVGAPPDRFAVSAGFTSVLRVLSRRQPLVVAIDDVPWLDRASAGVVTFAARRLEMDPVRFLLARRPGESSPLERAFGPLGVERMEVGPLSLGATRSMLMQRLGLVLPRRVLRHVFGASGGNPLFALELGRTLAERGVPEIGADLPLPDALEDLFGSRVDGLPAAARRVMLAVALSPDVRLTELAAAIDTAAIEDAINDDLLFVDGERVRPSHPLLAAAAKRHSRAGDRRRIHLALAGAVDDETLRALHLAEATAASDGGLAAVVASAATVASTRGAVQDAAELAAHALRLTPPTDEERTDRLLALAEYLVRAGEHPRATTLLNSRLEELPHGRPRARAHLLLGWSADLANHHAHLERALAESDADPDLRAIALATRAFLFAIDQVERLDDAEAWAREALLLASGVRVDVEERALHALASVRVLRGQPIDDLRRPFPAVSDGHPYIFRLVDRAWASQLAFRGQVEASRAVFETLLAMVEERGDVPSICTLSLQLSTLEARVGDRPAASRRLDQIDWLLDAPSIAPNYRACLEPLFAALSGDPREAERLAAQLIEEGTVRPGWQLNHVLRARGLAAILAGEPQQSVDSLRPIWQHMVREGIDDPGVFPMAPDLVEALVELGELDEARAVADRLGRLSVERHHPWGLASVKRCEALIRFSSGYAERAPTLLREAAEEYGAIGMRFDRARSLLIVGRSQRRFKKWAAARESLERSAAFFDELEAFGWAEQARAELARVGARKPVAEGALTVTEQRVVQLAVDGLSNKEIANSLFISVHTVEKHLSRAYAKLGVHSRRQLVQRLPLS